MPRTKMTNGAVVIPQAVRDAHGLRDGAEFDVIDGGQRIVLEIVPPHRPMEEQRQLTVEQFLVFVRSFPKYEGLPVTDEMMHEAINEAAKKDWERLERQWHEDKND